MVGKTPVDKLKSRRRILAKTPRKHQISLLREVGVGRRMALTPKARKLYDISVNLKATTRRLFVSNATNKERIKESNQFLKEELLSSGTFC
ncbi:hypothetical protein QE152_g27634 [Popillia japonica]|uniref:Uncharacterized protein n=1 Tax=Popillia japonica TaxID=7064 RepID=A0AAW1JUJ6_POPJA